MRHSAQSSGHGAGGLASAHCAASAVASPSRESVSIAGSVGSTGAGMLARGVRAPGAAGSPPPADVLGGPGGAQAASARLSRAIMAGARQRVADETEDRQMWVIYLEAGGVLVVVLLLVWWTLRGKR